MYVGDSMPDWPCPLKDPHADHFWSDGLVGYECPGVMTISPPIVGQSWSEDFGRPNRPQRKVERMKKNASATFSMADLDDCAANYKKALSKVPDNARVTIDQETKWFGYGTSEYAEKVVTGITFSWYEELS